MAVHELKTDPEVFDAVARGEKTHEIRFNDRDFKVGDVLVLRKTRFTGDQMREHGWPLDYIGKPLHRTVTHVLEGYGLMPGWVILSLRRTDENIYSEIAAEAQEAPAPKVPDHVCGLQGFGALGDECPACTRWREEYEANHRDRGTEPRKP